MRYFLLGISLLFCASSQAWNAAGHMTTGAMAYSELMATRPDIIDKVVAIMKAHPTPALFEPLLSQESGNVAKAERTFMAMTTWADEVRAPEFAPQYHRDSWHYINIIFAPDEIDFRSPNEIVANRVFEAFGNNAKIIIDGKSSDAEKAVALCWIFHLVGDIHQPLHTTALFNAEFPEGDRGGNSIRLRVKSTGETSNLHSFWDGVVAWNSNPEAARARAAQMQLAYPRATLSLLTLHPYLSAHSFEQWGRLESSPLAVSVAYENGAILNYPKDDGAFLLSTDYVNKARAVANERVALAGYRLADVLHALFSKP